MQVAAGDRSCEEQLVLRHSRLVRVCARPFFLAGGDSEDLIQEGMLGLLSAIREFTPERGVRFRTFAALCIRRRILTAVKAAVSGKHSPLNQSISLSLFLADQETLPGTAGNPEDVVIHQENLSTLEAALRSQLTPLESQVLARYLDGSSYSEIAEEVQRSTKAVDNAVQRIRHKTARYLSGDNSRS